MGALTTVHAMPVLPEDIERVLVTGDIGKLTPEQRVSYYTSVCQSLKLNPLTKPFDYIVLNGKTVLYAKKDATDQLRSIYGVSIQIMSREVVEGVYVVTARATNASGRTDEAIGAVPMPTQAEARANAIMKTETKAKRRVTLSICGLGFLDEAELDTIPPSAMRPVEPLGSVEAAQAVAVEKIEVLKKGKQTPDDPPVLAAYLQEASAPANRNDVYARLCHEIELLGGSQLAEDSWASATEGKAKAEIIVRRLYAAIQANQPPKDGV